WHVLALIGAWLGWEGLGFILFAASVQGILFAVAPGLGFGVSELPPMPQGAAPDGAEVEDEVAGGEDEAFLFLAVPFATVMALAAIEFLLFREEIQGFLANTLSFGP
ncbi:MAG: hypothetical protein VX938_11150, partial [Myxococcota bacterium]|nr:hypothetical protein [Myxococcota bacterium]